MTVTEAPVPSIPISVKRIGETVWVVRLLESLEMRTVSALRTALRSAVASDVTDVVVDLADAEFVSREGAAVLAEMAEVMRSRSGALWVAAPRSEDDGYTLRPIQEMSPSALAGLCPALDDALEAAGS